MSKNSISSIIEGNSDELGSNNSMESTENTTNNVDMISSSIMNPQNLINNHNGSTSKNIANPSMINLKNSYEDIKGNRNIDISEMQLFYFSSKGHIPPRFAEPVLDSVHFMGIAIVGQR